MFFPLAGGCELFSDRRGSERLRGAGEVGL